MRERKPAEAAARIVHRRSIVGVLTVEQGLADQGKAAATILACQADPTKLEKRSLNRLGDVPVAAQRRSDHLYSRAD